MAKIKIFDTIIIGGGAAGLSAAIYSRRYLMKTLLIQGPEPGGATAKASWIENYPGIKKISGWELIKNMEEQAREMGTKILPGEVKKIEKDGHCFTILSNNKKYLGKTLIFATGSTRRSLGLPQEKVLVGKGISYCTICDSPLYREKEVVIIGGGDASVKGAVLASDYAKKIYLITREKKLTAEPINLEKMKEKKNIVVIYNTMVKEIIGDVSLEKIILSKPYKGKRELKIKGLFVEIGAEPNVRLAQDLGVALDDKGYINVDPKTGKTNVHGIFAAGDVANAFGSFKQDITAAASGSIAATSAYRDLGEHKGPICLLHGKVCKNAKCE